MQTARLRSFVPLPTNWPPLRDRSRPREKIATRGTIIRYSLIDTFVTLIDILNDVNWKLWKLHGDLDFRSRAELSNDYRSYFEKVPRTLRKYAGIIEYLRRYREDVKSEDLSNCITVI